MNILEIIERRAGELRDDECWETDHKHGTHGYCRVSGRRLHRVAWEAHNAEPIPEGMFILHSCDNRRCFNPAHLRLGTAKDNMQDCLARNRVARHTKHRKYDYELIHTMYNEGSTIQEIALELGADWTTVERVIKENIAP